MMAMDDSEIVNGGETCDKFRAVQVPLDYGTNHKLCVRDLVYSTMWRTGEQKPRTYVKNVCHDLGIITCQECRRHALYGEIAVDGR
jgi:hypothetical protein